MARRTAFAIAILVLSLSGFALGGCGGSHRPSGKSGTQGFGSVIFTLRPAITMNTREITLVAVSTRGATTMYRLISHGKAYTFACTTSCSGVGSPTTP
jgi:hypothetical protein